MSASMGSDVEHVSKIISDSISKPEKFLEHQEALATKLRNSTKEIYDKIKTEEFTSSSNDTLSELIVDGFDDEQIWQELEMQNDFTIKELLSQIAFVASSKKCYFGHEPIDQITDTISNSKTALSISSNAENDVNSGNKDEDDLLENDEEDNDGEDNDEEDNDEEDNDGKILEDTDDDENELLEGEDGDDDNDDDDDDDDSEDERLKEILKRMEGDSQDADDATDDDDEGIDEDDDSEKDHDGDDDHVETDMFRDQGSGKPGKKSKSKSLVDDKFFSLDDMETFLDQEDRKEEKRRDQKYDEDEDSEDERQLEELMQHGAPSEEVEESKYMYADFFSESDKLKKRKKPNADIDLESLPKKKKRKNLLSDDEDGEDADAILGRKKTEKSSFEKRQERLHVQIDELEEAVVSEKPWQLTGEVMGSVRPENSLLQEDLDFDSATRLPPVITEDTTKTLEDLIKQRIMDKTWDDVERKDKPSENATEFKKRVVLDEEKSKMSLSQIYEQEYLKKQEEEDDEKEDEQHEEIRKSMTSLFTKLNALSNYHYTPQVANVDVKIISNQPSINMEEVAPVTSSEVSQLAPEEIKAKQKGELRGKEERTSTDKKRELRQKKKKQREFHAEKERKAAAKPVEKQQPSTKYAKERMLKELSKQIGKGVTVVKEARDGKKSKMSSAKFFTQLQDEVTNHIQSKKAESKTKKTKKTSAAKLKL